MIELIFTLDYEIYGDGQGVLQDLVWEPTEKLTQVFKHHGAKFVIFTEVAEFAQIERWQTDDGIANVRGQLRMLHQDGFELGLHIHPQWCSARFGSEGWRLNYDEYNLCKLSYDRVSEIVNKSLQYLREVVGDSTFTPLSFRAGNWLFQPSSRLARVLSDEGVKIDSSVFKNGFISAHSVDYRSAPANRHFWQFQNDVAREESPGSYDRDSHSY